MISRRSLLSGGAAALSGALSPWLLGGCAPKGGATGPVAIQWDHRAVHAMWHGAVQA
ncbi:MAG: hypothetical protein U1F35_11340 [Steroidobacteraceae bacterium]